MQVTNNSVRTRGRDGTFDKYHFCLDKIHSIKRYKFGKFEINGPRDPNGFLDRAYATQIIEVQVILFC